MGRRKFFFDGGSRPNPGPMEVAVVVGGTVHIRDLGAGDNNEAEWLALLAAVELATAAGETEVLFLGDSTLVVAQASGTAPCRSGHLQAYLAAFRKAVAALPSWRVRYVPRSQNLAGIALARRNEP